MKNLISVDKGVGPDGKIVAALGIEGESIKLQVGLEYPLVMLLEPAKVVIGNLIDKLEKIIPGDQVAIANKLKEEAIADLAKLLSEK